MRRVFRRHLPLIARVDLKTRARSVAAGSNVSEEWKAYRASAGARPVVSMLKAMAGKRERCFYCSDSRATDIEHFAPISIDKTTTFAWRNMLWICTQCNRKKSSRFPTNELGEPLLLNPVEIDPWSVLIVATATGVLAPRFTEGAWSPIGEETLNVLDMLNEEFLIEARVRSIRRISDAVDQLNSGVNTIEAHRNLLREVREDQLGIASWFLLWDGAAESRFLELKLSDATTWRRLVKLVSTLMYGSES